MASPLVWFRLYRGKAWHLRMVGDSHALCGAADMSARLDGLALRAPVSSASTTDTSAENARLCEACGAASDMIADAIRLAREGDPRRPLPGVVGDLVGLSGPDLQAAVEAELHAGEVYVSRETAHHRSRPAGVAR